MAQIKNYGLKSTIGSLVGITAQYIEITVSETPMENWGIHGKPGDELALGYMVEV